VGNLAELLEMPVLSEFLGMRGARLQEIAVEHLVRAAGTRALSSAIRQTGEDIEAMGEDEIDEGLVRVAVADAAAERSDELAIASDLLAFRGVDEVAAAVEAGALAREASQAGMAEVAAGADLVGKGAAAATAGEALQAGAGQ